MDLGSANAAGIKSVAVTCGYATEDELCAHTPQLASNALEAVKIIVVS